MQDNQYYISMANEIYINSYWGDISNEDWGNIYTSILNNSEDEEQKKFLDTFDIDIENQLII